MIKFTQFVSLSLFSVFLIGCVDSESNSVTVGQMTNATSLSQVKQANVMSANEILYGMNGFTYLGMQFAHVLKQGKDWHH